MNNTNGIHRDISNADYHADSALSCSGAKLLLPPSCPAKFRHIQQYGQPPRKVWDFGTVAHGLVLGKCDEIAVLDPAVHGLKRDGTPADSPTATTAWKQSEAEARERGATPIHIDDYRRAETMAQVVRSHPVAGELFADGEAEVSIRWTDPATGIALRARPDWITKTGTIVDYKTSKTANPAALEKDWFSFGYHMQAAWYVDGWHAVTGETLDFVFVAQEKDAPHLVQPIRYDDAALAEARRANREAIELYARCLETGVWPTYTDDNTALISLPTWALPELEIA